MIIGQQDVLQGDVSVGETPVMHPLDGLQGLVHVPPRLIFRRGFGPTLELLEELPLLGVLRREIGKPLVGPRTLR